MRFKRRFTMTAHIYPMIIAAILTASLLGCSSETVSSPAADGRQEGARAIYSPQLEYTEWVPMGRGDPLKNDPTYDYSPPKLDLVKYWVDGTGHKDKSKTDILLLGVPQHRQKEPANKHGPIRRNFVYNDLPTMLIPPPVQPNYNDLIQSNAPVESYQMPVWNGNSNSRKAVIDTYVEPGKTYSTVFRPILSSTIYTYNHHYKYPATNEGNYVEAPYHYHSKPATFYKRPNFETSTHFPYSRPDPVQTSHSNYVPIRASFAETAAPFTKPTEPPVEENSHIVDANNINYEFSYETTIATTTTERQTTTHAPLPPPPPSTTTTTMAPPTTSMYARFEKPTKPLHRMSLIIEGHSKVKTYGQTFEDPKEKHRPKLVPILGKEDPVVRNVVNTDEKGTTLHVEHLHTPPNPKVEPKPVDVKKKEKDESAMSSLFSFLDFGTLLGGKDESSEENDSVEQNNLAEFTENFRQARNLTLAEPHFKKKKI